MADLQTPKSYWGVEYRDGDVTWVDEPTAREVVAALDARKRGIWVTTLAGGRAYLVLDDVREVAESTEALRHRADELLAAELREEQERRAYGPLTILADED